MFRKRTSSHGGECLVADQHIQADSLVFSSEEWTSERREGWTVLSIDEIAALTEEARKAFLEYSYDVDWDRSVGTFDRALATHGSNFINHSCDPNLGFDRAGNVRALRDVRAGEELTMDYATFVVTSDQSFVCGCDSYNCREVILHDDWMMLYRYGKYIFQGFIQEKVDYLNGLQNKNHR